ncbi:MAG: hypothetical protein AB7H81_16845 [Vicinamibacterales bacterium]
MAEYARWFQRRVIGPHGARAVAALACAVGAVLSAPVATPAQTVEVTPFGGYRVGGSFAEVDGRTVVDDDGGPGVGVVVDAAFGSPMAGLKLEGVFSRERANLRVRGGPLDPPGHVRVEVDYIQVGGVQELADGRVRPFLAGLLGLTRYAVPGDTEVRFSVGVGTGAKFFATRNIGLRLDARGYLTIVDAGGAAVCGGFGCAIAYRANPAFQADFTAGLIVAF